MLIRLPVCPNTNTAAARYHPAANQGKVLHYKVPDWEQNSVFCNVPGVNYFCVRRDLLM